MAGFRQVTINIKINPFRPTKSQFKIVKLYYGYFAKSLSSGRFEIFEFKITLKN